MQCHAACSAHPVTLNSVHSKAKQHAVLLIPLYSVYVREGGPSQNIMQTKTAHIANWRWAKLNGTSQSLQTATMRAMKWLRRNAL